MREEEERRLKKSRDLVQPYVLFYREAYYSQGCASSSRMQCNLMCTFKIARFSAASSCRPTGGDEMSGFFCTDSQPSGAKPEPV